MWLLLYASLEIYFNEFALVNLPCNSYEFDLYNDANNVYKVDNIANFVHSGKTRIGGSFRVTLVVDWWFLPNIFGPWWGPTKAIYHSVNTDRVIILFAGGGDTWTQFSVIELVWTFCTERRWGAKNQIFWSCKSVVQINLYGEFFVGLRQHRKWIWGGDSIWRWWGHLNTI